MAKRITVISTVHKPHDVRVFKKEARTLATAGYDVHFVVPAPESSVVDGVTIHALPAPRNRLDRMVRVQLAALREALRTRADAYHFHDPELLPLAVFLKALTRRSIVYDVHENVRGQILSKHWIAPALRSAVSALYGVLERVALRAVDAVIVARKDLYEMEPYRSHQPCVLVQNYPIVEPIAERTGLDEVDRSAEAEVPTFVYLGGLSRIRGILEIVEACARLERQTPQRFRVLLIGPCQPPSFEEDVRSLIAREGLDDTVRLAGFLPHDEALAAVRSCVAGIVTFLPEPNHVTSQPTKLFEYMLAGVAVIASDFPYWREVVEGERCGILVDPTDPSAIAEAMAYLLEHPEEARAMGARGREAVLARYNWQSEAGRLLELYRSLLGE